MANPHIQTSFAAGELAPKLRSRVDIAKYHSGAATMRNFYVDYSAGGASTRQGTKYILKTKLNGARLVPFQPSSTLSYVLEFGQNYLRFYSNGAAIVEPAFVVSGATQANPCVITVVGNNYAIGDWIFIAGVGGMTQLNGNYYIVANVAGNLVTLNDLFGNAVNSTGYGAFTTNGAVSRVYTITTPYLTQDLFPNPATGNPGLKFVQNVTSLIICHPNYPACELTINTAANWTFAQISFGASIQPPTGLSGATAGVGTGWYYGYVVTSLDANNQESGPSAVLNINNVGAPSAITNTVSWSSVPGAQSYNVYKASPNTAGATAVGLPYGFIGNCTGVSFNDPSPGIAPDFSQTPPIPTNPFLGGPIQQVNITAGGSYSGVAAPSMTIAAPSSGTTATAYALFDLLSSSINNSGGGSIHPYHVGDIIVVQGNVVLQVTSVNVSNGVTGYNVLSPGSLTFGATLIATAVQTSTSGIGTGFVLNTTWQAYGTRLTQAGSGYTSVPSVTFSSGAATAVAVLGVTSAGNPAVPGFFQERLMLANQPQSIQDYNLSVPGAFFNFDVSNPAQDDDAISGTIIAEELNDIRCLVPVPTGMLAGTGRGAWLINGGGGLSVNNAITTANQVASPQGFNGFNDLKPIKINYDVLYGTNKGNYVRDLSYNIYAAIFSGSDISVWSNHLFFGYYIADWGWAEEPFKTLWGVRSDGQLISLAYVKEQELVGWARHDTNGQFKAICSVTETVQNGNVVDAVYIIAERVVQGTVVQYVERMADRYFKHGYIDSWSVDAGLQTVPAFPSSSATSILGVTGDASTIGNVVTITTDGTLLFTSTMATNNWIIHTDDGGVYTITAFTSGAQVTAKVTRVPNYYNTYNGNQPFITPANLWAVWQPATTVTGMQHIAGLSVVGTADGAAIGPLTVSASGSVTLATAACKITLGLAFLPQLQSLPLEPASAKGTTQSDRKKFPDITLRVADTLGLQVGTSFSNALTVKDFQIGAIPSLSTGPALVTDLINPSLGANGQVTDGFYVNDPLWQEAGQLCIQQNLPYPATILGIIPSVALGDQP